MANDALLIQKARVNTKEQFSSVFNDEVTKAFLTRQGRNEKIIMAFMSNPEMRRLIMEALLNDVYMKAHIEE